MEAKPMWRRVGVATTVIIGLFVGHCDAQVKPVTVTLQVDGVERQALVYPGRDAAAAPAPLVLSFHGFGGLPTTAPTFHRAWPEATVVYPAGLPVKALNSVDRGWQQEPGA